MSENFEDLVNGAEEAFEHHDFEEASRKFEAALGARPYPCAQKSRIHRRIGEIAYRAEQLLIARQHLEEAEEGYSRHCCHWEDRQAYANTLVLLAHVYRDLGEAELSTEALARARWKREQMVMENWRLANQLCLLALALAGMLLGLGIFREIGLSMLSVGGISLLLACLVVGTLSGAVLAIALENVAGPLIVSWRLRKAVKLLNLRNPIKVK